MSTDKIPFPNFLEVAQNLMHVAARCLDIHSYKEMYPEGSEHMYEHEVRLHRAFIALLNKDDFDGPKEADLAADELYDQLRLAAGVDVAARYRETIQQALTIHEQESGCYGCKLCDLLRNVSR